MYVNIRHGIFPWLINMGCVQGRARRRIADMQIKTTHKPFQIKKKLVLKKKYLKNFNLSVVIEASESHEASHEV